MPPADASPATADRPEPSRPAARGAEVGGEGDGVTVPPPRVAPESSAPNISAPGVPARDISAPGVSAPDIPAPDISTSGVSAPDIPAPDIPTSGVSAPDIPAPGIPISGVQAPDIPAQAGLTGARTPTAPLGQEPEDAPGEPGADPAVGAGGVGLTERELRILAFEQQWWRHAGAKEQAIRDAFGLSATRYYQLLNGLLDNPAALAAEPVLVSRLSRLRSSRARNRRR